MKAQGILTKAITPGPFLTLIMTTPLHETEAECQANDDTQTFEALVPEDQDKPANIQPTLNPPHTPGPFVSMILTLTTKNAEERARQEAEVVPSRRILSGTVPAAPQERDRSVKSNSLVKDSLAKERKLP